MARPSSPSSFELGPWLKAKRCELRDELRCVPGEPNAAGCIEASMVRLGFWALGQSGAF